MAVRRSGNAIPASSNGGRMGIRSPCGRQQFYRRIAAQAKYRLFLRNLGDQMKAPFHSAPISEPEIQTDWFQEGYRAGEIFARSEADYDELAAVYRAGTIPTGWDIYRAEILNRHLGVPDFDFQAYARGFARACIGFYKKI